MSQDGFKSDCPEVHCDISVFYFGSVISHAWFDQRSGHKHDIYLYGKLFPKLLTQAVIKLLSSCSRKLDGCFFLSIVLEVTVQKNSKQTLQKCRLKR